MSYTNHHGQAWYAKVFMDATDPIIIEDLDGIVLDLNREAERAYGFAREELIGKPIRTLVPPERHAQARTTRDGRNGPSGLPLAHPEASTINSPFGARPAATFIRLVFGSCAAGTPTFAQVSPLLRLAQHSTSPSIPP